MDMNQSFTSTSLIRYAVAFVFVTSGVMKLFSTELAEVFIGLGLPFPDIMLYVTAFLEIICGILIFLNRSVKNAVIPLIGIMIAAILLTKLPLLHSGILPFAFKARLDIVMLMLLYILYSKSPS
jgi:putative oxidoreductase